jgi:hypothetical protein
MPFMLTFASQAFANGTWTITPEEPATLQLALAGLGALAVYAALTGWRPRRTATIVNRTTVDERGQTSSEREGTTARRAA